LSLLLFCGVLVIARRRVPWKNSWFQIALFTLLVSWALLEVDFVRLRVTNAGAVLGNDELKQGDIAESQHDYVDAMQWYQKADADGWTPASSGGAGTRE
jgi:hypothetical protein